MAQRHQIAEFVILLRAGYALSASIYVVSIKILRRAASLAGVVVALKRLLAVPPEQEVIDRVAPVAGNCLFGETSGVCHGLCRSLGSQALSAKRLRAAPVGIDASASFAWIGCANDPIASLPADFDQFTAVCGGTRRWPTLRTALLAPAGRLVGYAASFAPSLANAAAGLVVCSKCAWSASLNGRGGPDDFDAASGADDRSICPHCQAVPVRSGCVLNVARSREMASFAKNTT